MMLSVVIPVYNEEATVLQLVRKVQEVDLEKEIILVDDYSTDGTREILRELEKEDGIRVFYHSFNQGKGAALRTGFQQVRGEITIIQDADMEYDPQEYHKLIRPILDGKADVVYGSRFIGETHRVHLFWHYVGNTFLTLLSNMFTNLNLTDMETCYKVFKAEIIKQINVKENRFGFEPEITAKIAKIKGIRIYEVGISYSGRTYEEGKKINWRDGVAAIYCILKYNLFS